MTQILQGQTITLTAQFYGYAGGPAQDVSSLTITITPVGSTTPTVGPTATGIAHAATGLYTYSWAVPVDQATGDYTVVWAGAGGVQASEVLSVLATSTGTWAQLADVTAVTGKAATLDQLFQANSIIEILSGRLYSISSTKIGARNAEWLKRAVAYQAPFIASNPDIFGRLDLTALGQEGRALGLKDTALILAPMAKRSLDRLSWKRSRSMHVRSPFQDGFGPISSDPDSAGNDAYEPWSPM